MKDKAKHTASKWQLDVERHEARFTQLVLPHLLRRSRHIKDPVVDFLFEYYAFRPSHLRRYSPGMGVILEGPSASSFLKRSEFRAAPDGVVLDPTNYFQGNASAEKFVTGTRWILNLLENTQSRDARFGCFGMHEWAMLYKTKRPRHEVLNLRVSPTELAGVVERESIRCSHYDAFRFFTDQAKALNQHQLRREDMTTCEQPGCLHTNMDVYRWAFKRAPWISSGLTMDAFELALDIRRLDMAASPYDVSSLGIEPVKVETRGGRDAYARKQRVFSNKAGLLRQRLIDEYQCLLLSLESVPGAFAIPESTS